MYRLPIILTLLATVAVTPARAGSKVDVVVGPAAPKLEQFAAEELRSQLEQLFAAEVTVADRPPAKSDFLILVGSPATNPAVRELAGGRWPKLSDQGHVLQSVERDGRAALVLGGGSPAATLWAVYELGHHFGIRSFLHGDVLPARTPVLKLDGLDRTLEPAVRCRAWETLGDGPAGFESWGLADQRRLLRQLAKLKFNRVVLAVSPWQPFAPLEVGGVRKATGVLARGGRFRVDGDTAGRRAFAGAREFGNPDLAGKDGYPQQLEAGVALARGIIDSAHELGMSATLAFPVLEFPKEFAGLLRTKPGPEALGVVPGPDVPADDPELRRLMAAQVRAYLDTYPEADALYLLLPGRPDSRGEAAARALLADPGLVRRKDGRNVEVVLGGIAPARLPSLYQGPAPRAGALLPPDDLAEVPGKAFDATLALPLGNAGVLPQLPTGRAHALLAGLRKHGWHGYLVRAGAPGELSPAVYFVSRAAFDPTLTPAAAHDGLLTPALGPGGPERVARGFALVEEAAALLARGDPAVAALTPDVLTRHLRRAGDPPPAWKEAGKRYAGAMDEMYRGIQRTRQGTARPVLLYHAKRLEFAVHYLNAAEAAALAGQAKAKGDADQHLEQLERATESIYNALHALGEVARDPGDRGVIAALNEYGYRPLQAALRAAEEKQ